MARIVRDDSALAAAQMAGAGAGAERPIYYLTDAELDSFSANRVVYTSLPRTETVHAIDHQVGCLPEAVWLSLFPYLGYSALTMRKVSHYFRQEKFQLKDGDLNKFRNQNLAVACKSGGYPPQCNLVPFFRAIPDGSCVDVRNVLYTTVESQKAIPLLEIVNLYEKAPFLTSIGDARINLNCDSHGCLPGFISSLRKLGPHFPSFMRHFVGAICDMQLQILFFEAAKHMESFCTQGVVGGIDQELAPDSLLSLKTLAANFSSIQDFTTMMHAASRLESLVLSSLNLREDIFSNFTSGSLPYLRRLAIIGCSIASPVRTIGPVDCSMNSPLISALDAASGLESLNSSDAAKSCKPGAIHEALKDREGIYTDLLSIEIGGENFVSRDMVSVFKAMPNLVKVILNMQKKRVNLAAIPASLLFSLEEISLNSSYVRLSDLKVLIEKSPKLQVISVCDCVMLGSEEMDFLRAQYKAITFK